MQSWEKERQCCCFIGWYWVMTPARLQSNFNPSTWRGKKTSQKLQKWFARLTCVRISQTWSWLQKHKPLIQVIRYLFWYNPTSSEEGIFFFMEKNKLNSKQIFLSFFLFLDKWPVILNQTLELLTLSLPIPNGKKIERNRHPVVSPSVLQSTPRSCLETGVFCFL